MRALVAALIGGLAGAGATVLILSSHVCRLDRHAELESKGDRLGPRVGDLIPELPYLRGRQQDAASSVISDLLSRVERLEEQTAGEQAGLDRVAAAQGDPSDLSAALDRLEVEHRDSPVHNAHRAAVLLRHFVQQLLASGKADLARSEALRRSGSLGLREWQSALILASIAQAESDHSEMRRYAEIVLASRDSSVVARIESELMMASALAGEGKRDDAIAAYDRIASVYRDDADPQVRVLRSSAESFARVLRLSTK